jgi:hypothetical protein
VEFEPFFHRLEARYRGVADFAGVIDAGADLARAYGSISVGSISASSFFLRNPP